MSQAYLPAYNKITLRNLRFQLCAPEVFGRFLSVKFAGLSHRNNATISHAGKTTAMKDFFISYTGNDQNWTVGLDGWLRSAGYTTTVQCVDFVPGSNFVLEMHQALQECRRTLLVLSPDFLLSRFAAPEWAATFVQDPDGRKRKLVGVIVRDCEPGGLLAAVTRINLTGLTYDDAHRKFLVDIEATVANRITTSGRKVKRTTAPVASTTSIKQQTKGHRNVVIGQVNGDFVQTEKVNKRNVVEADERHISEETAQLIKDRVDRLAENDLLRGIPNAQAGWHARLQRKFRVTSYKLICRERGADALAWLQQSAARERGRLRRAAKPLWRNQLYGAIYSRTKSMGLNSEQVHVLATERLKLKKPVASLSDLTDRHLKTFYGVIYRLHRKR